jgi:hypothetical protein
LEDEDFFLADEVSQIVGSHIVRFLDGDAGDWLVTGVVATVFAGPDEDLARRQFEQSFREFVRVLNHGYLVKMQEGLESSDPSPSR